MIMSVSTLTIAKGAATPVSLVNLSMACARSVVAGIAEPRFTQRRRQRKGGRFQPPFL
jgi:hypothetical protein